jgi:3-deoxy-D-manno-octulosonic-acid transferase
MWIWPYNLVVLPALWVAFRILWLFNRKVRRGLRGRFTSMQRLRVYMRNKPPERRLWVHASSMGEFEQAKPIIEALKREDPNLAVVASFFSPSGYENNLRYTSIDAIVYIPFDSMRRAKAFLTLLQPAAAVFIRYDIWPNHIRCCNDMGIPVMLANATLRPTSPRLWPGARAFHRRLFNLMTAILTVSEQDADQFRRFDLDTPSIDAVGDTRYDRVVNRAKLSGGRSPLPDHIRGQHRVIVFGSSWNEDEEVFLPAVQRLLQRYAGLLCIIVPHEPTIEHLEWLEYRFRGVTATRRFSWISSWQGERVLLVDSIGILLPLYASADIAFVGGGFRSNVHNTLEPAAYGIPVLFGPKIANSREAADLVEARAAAIVRSRRDVYRSIRRLLDDEEARSEAGRRAKDFVTARAGSTAQILHALRSLLPPHSGSD